METELSRALRDHAKTITDTATFHTLLNAADEIDRLTLAAKDVKAALKMAGTICQAQAVFFAEVMDNIEG